MNKDELTTAETLVVEALVAQRLLGAERTVFPGRCWIKPQLVELEGRGLLTWGYDEGDFVVTPTTDLIHHPDAIRITGRFRATTMPEGAFA